MLKCLRFRSKRRNEEAILNSWGIRCLHSTELLRKPLRLQAVASMTSSRSQEGLFHCTRISIPFLTWYQLDDSWHSFRQFGPFSSLEAFPRHVTCSMFRNGMNFLADEHLAMELAALQHQQLALMHEHVLSRKNCILGSSVFWAPQQIPVASLGSGIGPGSDKGQFFHHFRRSKI